MPTTPQLTPLARLGDWMNLAYTLSTMWKRLHPQQAYSRENHHADVYAEPALLATFALFVLSCLSLGLFLLVTRVSCRPIDTDALAFAAGPANYYGMQYVNNVCETELKVREDGGWTLLAATLIAAGGGLLGANQALLGRLNRLHAAARADWGAAAFAQEPPSEREAMEGRSLFYAFARRALAAKLAVAAGCCAAFTWFVARQESSSIGRAADGSIAGGSLLSRYGGECDGARIRWDDPFPGRFRCHIERESCMQYLKAFVYLLGTVLMLTQLGMCGTCFGFVKAFSDDVRAEEAEAAAAEAAAAEEAAGGEGAEGGVWRPTADEASLVRALRVSLKLGMGFLKHNPKEGLPEMLAQIIVGKPPSRRDLAAMTGHLLSLKEAPSDEVADLLYCVLQQAMNGGIGGGDAVKDLLKAACIAWSDSERQLYMKGMLDILEQQELAKRQTDALPLGQPGQPGGQRQSAAQSPRAAAPAVGRRATSPAVARHATAHFAAG